MMDNVYEMDSVHRSYSGKHPGHFSLHTTLWSPTSIMTG